MVGDSPLYVLEFFFEYFYQFVVLSGTACAEYRGNEHKQGGTVFGEDVFVINLVVGFQLEILQMFQGFASQSERVPENITS